VDQKTGIGQKSLLMNKNVIAARDFRPLRYQTFTNLLFKKSNIVEAIALLFIILFVYAASSKLQDTEKFQVQLGQSPMLAGISEYVSWLVPAIEFIISILLAFKRSRLIAFYASFSLMTMFTCYIVLITNFSEYVPCSCGGVLQKMSWNQHLIFNIFFVFLGAIGIILTERNRNASVKLL